ncbi:hypothetical protein ACFQS2_16245 [Brachybacterium sp. GCM10030267]|uniref:hypothetical protein n=1 Tax=Brachybacterium sp. GCM10030267 TaxID=3273381 RepID=UPI0036206EA3
MSWNGLFGEYLPLARLSDEVADIVPKSVDLLEQLALDVAEKYCGDFALDDCMRIFSIHRRLLSGAPLRYDYVAYGGAKKNVEHQCSHRAVGAHAGSDARWSGGAQRCALRFGLGGHRASG